MASERLDEWKEEDLEDLESTSSGGEPGVSRAGPVIHTPEDICSTF